MKKKKIITWEMARAEEKLAVAAEAELKAKRAKLMNARQVFEYMQFMIATLFEELGNDPEKFCPACRQELARRMDAMNARVNRPGGERVQ